MSSSVIDFILASKRYFLGSIPVIATSTLKQSNDTSNPRGMKSWGRGRDTSQAAVSILWSELLRPAMSPADCWRSLCFLVSRAGLGLRRVPIPRSSFLLILFRSGHRAHASAPLLPAVCRALSPTGQTACNPRFLLCGFSVDFGGSFQAHGHLKSLCKSG